MTITATDLLDGAMLAGFDERAPVYDRENRFFDEDFEELRAGKYFEASLPVEFGGRGLSLAEINRLQRRIAYVAPATAIAPFATRVSAPSQSSAALTSSSNDATGVASASACPRTLPASSNSSTTPGGSIRW